MYEACKSTCHEWTSKDEVGNDKDDIVVEKEELIMTKEMETKKILRYREKPQKISPQYESELWKAMEVNDELKVNVDEQQDDIKHLKEQCDIDNEDEF